MEGVETSIKVSIEEDKKIEQDPSSLAEDVFRSY
jgi:hypothetical protein